MSALAQQLIQQAKQQRLTRLDLGNCGLTEIPEEVFELTWLEELILSNEWIEWDENINYLFEQTSHNLGEVNIISILPEGFKKLTELRILIVVGGWKEGCNINNLSALSSLVNLSYLYLGSNQISDVSALSSLVNLSYLYLGGNQISDISALSSLVNLLYLYLGYNQISDISALSTLVNLSDLDLGYNQIFDISVLSGLVNLWHLDLGFNKISGICALNNLLNLAKLDLSDNKILSLKPLIGLIKKRILLKIELGYSNAGIMVVHNPLIHPPIEIVEMGNQAVLDYFDALEQGTDYLNEAKLIIVGEPAAGKTSLMECLWNPEFSLIPEAESQSTLGIEVREGWEFAHPAFKGVNFTANIWDFGGQHIQYMTHQFFLTPNAVYVLVAANDRKEATNFPYWFKIINLLGQDEGRYSPVIVVLNEKDPQFIHKFNFDRTAIERQYPHIPLKVCEVNLAKRDAKFAALQQTIQEALADLPLVKNVKPAAWQPIREALRKRAKRDAHINFESYVRICKKHGVKEHNQQLLFLRYLHRLGSLLYFENDSSLSDFIILDPKWAVDTVYCVIADKQIADNNGYFTRDQLDKIWASKKHKKGMAKYNMNEQNKLFSLMKKDNFEICYALQYRPKEFIAPQLLTVTPPAYDWDNRQNLKFRYQYTFMPEGIIARLIVRLSHLLKKQAACDLIWRHGLLLEDSEKQCSALIREDEVAGLKVIDIAINGDQHQRKYLLYEIRKELNDLHKRWFSNIQVDQMIPCNCRECISQPDASFYFKFSTLQQAQARGKFYKECDKSFINVPILSLLEGICQPEEIKIMGQENDKAIHIVVGDHSQVVLGNENIQKQNSDNYTNTQTLSITQRKNLNELIKTLRKADLSDEDMDVVDQARQLLRADEKQPTPETQGRLLKLFNGVKEFMDLSNNTIGVATAALPALPAVIQAIQQALS
jgi:Leucine-rich repeat (LRR) protein